MIRKGSVAYMTFLLACMLCIPQQQLADQSETILCNKLYLGIDVNQEAAYDVPFVRSRTPYLKTEKDWTIILYIAADNDLAPFAIRNIKQMARIGSNEHFNIVVQLDIRKTTGEKVTRRYYIKKGKILHVNASDPSSQRMDSGNPDSLISCCNWAINNFPARQFGLVLWNHGSGSLDPVRVRGITTEELFFFNPETQQLELDRTIGYLERMENRGICWDDTTGNYLSNPNLDYALDIICQEYLGGDKFLFIGFDACLMQMVEIANIMKKYAHIMIGSEEVELGYGWNYADILEPFTRGTMGPVDLADHIIATYKKSYERITNDYTLSALNLDIMHFLEKNINEIACLLIEGLRNQKNGMVKKAIKASRNKLVCTHFEEPTYIDLHHWYNNLLTNLASMQLRNPQHEARFKNKMRTLLEEGRSLIEGTAFVHTAGNTLPLARGISLYFPERGIHRSYKNLPFAQETEWMTFLTQYLIL